MENVEALALAALAKKRRPFRRLKAVDEWIAEHREVQWRYRFLVLTGPSKTGKTQYALSLVAANRSLELNMASCDEPDLRQYSWDTHDLILLDECSAKTILAQKKLMQAGPCWLNMGNSKTNAYAYSVWLHAKLFVVCTNRWELELETLSAPDADWLQDNSLVIRIDSPLYVTD